MKIDSTEFGSISIDGTTYTHDVLIHLSGEVAKRKKKLSKKYYGTSHVISREEAEFIYEKGCETLVWAQGSTATSNCRRRPPGSSSITIAG